MLRLDFVRVPAFVSTAYEKPFSRETGETVLTTDVKTFETIMTGCHPNTDVQRQMRRVCSFNVFYCSVVEFPSMMPHLKSKDSL